MLNRTHLSTFSKRSNKPRAVSLPSINRGINDIKVIKTLFTKAQQIRRRNQSQSIPVKICKVDKTKLKRKKSKRTLNKKAMSTRSRYAAISKL